MIRDTIKFSGRPTFTLIGPDGQVKQRFSVDNMIVTTGKQFFLSRSLGTSAAPMSHMALGSSTTAPSSGDTSLIAEIGRVTLTSSVQLNSVITYIALFGPGVASGVITEAGILNANTAGTLLARTTFAPVNKDILDSLYVTWDVSAY